MKRISSHAKWASITVKDMILAMSVNFTASNIFIFLPLYFLFPKLQQCGLGSTCPFIVCTLRLYPPSINQSRTIFMYQPGFPCRQQLLSWDCHLVSGLIRLEATVALLVLPSNFFYFSVCLDM